MPTTKLNNGQLPATLSSKTIDNTNNINTTTTRLKITGGSSGQVLSTDGSGNLSWATAGGVSDGDKGDITVSGSGGTWTIDNDAITYAKIQNVSAASRILGRGSASAGDVQEISIGTGLTMSGTTLSALGAPTAVITKTADETVTSSTTLQNDDALTWASFTSGKSYYIELDILTTRVNTSGNPGLNYSFSGNSNGYYNFGASAALCDGISVQGVTVANNAGVPRTLKITVALKATANFTGTFMFAQSTSSATGVTVMAGSRMTIWEVA
jgi:hypothetical protein